MSIKLVHIGIGKTATTTLQKIVFPKQGKRYYSYTISTYYRTIS